MSFAAGISPDLAWAAAWVFLFGFIIASRDLPLRFALPIASIKILIPLLYFAYNATGAWHLSDDVKYFQSGVSLLRMGFDPVSVLTDPLGFGALATVAGTGWHVAYHLWNLVAVDLFGPHYYAPVLLNVGATFVSGWFFFRILRRAGFSAAYSKAALAFFLLHWDTLVWSSFLNLKDTLVVTFVLALFYQLVESLYQPKWWRIIPICLLVAGMFFLRFYAPVLVAAALLTYLFLTREGGWKLASALIVTAAAVWIYKYQRGTFGQIEPRDLFTGLPQFILTPLPWNLSAGYEFLMIPSGLHLMLAVPALLAIPALWKSGGHARLLIVYLVLVLVAFSILPHNRGIRQRQMTGFVFVWMQFHALRAFARYALATGRPGQALQAKELPYPPHD